LGLPVSFVATSMAVLLKWKDVGYGDDIANGCLDHIYVL
jgi:hypothetical protein